MLNLLLSVLSSDHYKLNKCIRKCVTDGKQSVEGPNESPEIVRFRRLTRDQFLLLLVGGRMLGLRILYKLKIC